jgi:hypothetical protein
MPTPSKSAPAHTTSISSVPAVKGPTKASPLTAIPASARVHPTTVKAAVKASTPTTTYVPASGISGGISLTRKAGVGTTATGTTATPAKSTVLGYLVLHKRSQHSNTLSTGAIAIAVIAALLVLACIGWALARRRAFEPHWLLSLRHAMAEAGFRLSATWAEFSDWVRLGH